MSALNFGFPYAPPEVERISSPTAHVQQTATGGEGLNLQMCGPRTVVKRNRAADNADLQGVRSYRFCLQDG